MAHTRIAECSEELVELRGCGACCHAATAKHVSTWLFPMPPSMGSPAAWRVPGTRPIGIISDNYGLYSHRPKAASDLSWTF